MSTITIILDNEIIHRAGTDKVPTDMVIDVCTADKSIRVVDILDDDFPKTNSKPLSTAEK